MSIELTTDELAEIERNACEEAGQAPELSIEVDDGKIIVTDNGPGIPVDTFKRILDFSVRVSSREAYVSPTKGAQGACRRAEMVRASIISLMLLFLSATSLFAQFPSILDANDVDAKGTLHAMTATGDLTNRQHAEAWMVLSSVALGMGREKCSFPRSDDMTFMWKPALDSMSAEEIFTLNRLVTSNFRNAEKNGRISLDRLFPITRQAVIALTDRRGAWNCEKVSEVWTAASNYMKTKGGARGNGAP